MFAKFQYEPLPLGDISLDEKNPRLVVQTPLTSQDAILAYLFEHEDLGTFIRRIAHAGKNKGAERPYVVKKGTKYIVVEGNSRIAAYKVLAGLMKPPATYDSQMPHVSDDLKASLLVVDCSIAPNRDSLLPIMADSHFGVGDKSKWGYLGSRKAIHDEHASGKSIVQLSRAFGVSQADIVEYLLEYQLYLESLKLNWTGPEKARLLDPRVQFNPPVRFLQSKGHKELMGVTYDRPNLKISFADQEARRKFHHLVKKLVVNPQTGLGATATYLEVFKDYQPPQATSSTANSGTTSGNQTGSTTGGAGASTAQGATGSGSGTTGGPKLGTGALFNYPVKLQNNLLKQLMKEASTINAKKLPSAATFLLRNLLESLLKHIIDQSNANPNKNQLSLENALAICKGVNVPLGQDDKKILKDFEKNHLDYVNLGSHGNVVPHPDRVFQIRDSLDQFIRKNI